MYYGGCHVCVVTYTCSKVNTHMHTVDPDWVANTGSHVFQVALQRYRELYDLSRSEEEALCSLAVSMCLDGQPLAMIQQLLEVAVGPRDTTLKDVVRSAIVKIMSTLR